MEPVEDLDFRFNCSLGDRAMGRNTALQDECFQGTAGDKFLVYLPCASETCRADEVRQSERGNYAGCCAAQA